MGFDIVRLPIHGISLAEVAMEDGANDLESKMTRAPLARIGRKGSGPMVGKYVVDIDSVRTNAIPSIAPTTRTNNPDRDEIDITLVLLDEVGKMEMLCPGFLDAVNRCLNGDRTIVLGTIPTPRYGRVIPAVEEIRARPDVTTVHVQKSNREELRDHVRNAVLSVLQQPNDSRSVASAALLPYLYHRAIGAPSMDKRKATRNPPSSQSDPTRQLSPSTNDAQENSLGELDRVKPCGPLVHPSTPPKVLLLGETASPNPQDEDMAYVERSMWTVLGEMVGQPPSCTNMPKEEYQLLRDAILSAGVAIWDVLSDVHIKSPRTKRKKKQARTSNANPILDFVSERDSIEAIAFIGAKAKKSFVSHVCAMSPDTNELVLDDSSGRRISLIVLPSSSRLNSRMTVAEKADEWRNSLIR